MPDAGTVRFGIALMKEADKKSDENAWRAVEAHESQLVYKTDGEALELRCAPSRSHIGTAV